MKERMVKLGRKTYPGRRCFAAASLSRRRGELPSVLGSLIRELLAAAPVSFAAASHSFAAARFPSAAARTLLPAEKYVSYF